MADQVAPSLGGRGELDAFKVAGGLGGGDGLQLYSHRSFQAAACRCRRHFVCPAQDDEAAAGLLAECPQGYGLLVRVDIIETIDDHRDHASSHQGLYRVRVREPTQPRESDADLPGQPTLNGLTVGIPVPG